MNSGHFVVGAQLASRDNLVISEIHYRPAPPRPGDIAAGFDSAKDFEFIELGNIGSTPVDLAGARFENGIDFEFSTQADFTEVAGGEHVLLVANRVAFEHRYGSGLPVIGEFANDTSLANSGERLRLVAADENSIRDFAYDDKTPWPESADGGGYSLSLVNANANPDHSLPENWRAGLDPGGSPGRADGGIGFNDWRQAWFDPSSVDFPVRSASSADPDGDGIANAMEFLLGSSPLDFNSTGLEVDTMPEGDLLHLTISFTRRAALPANVLQIEQSSVPGNWSEAPTSLLQSLKQGALIKETHRFVTPLEAEKRQMIRLRIDI